MSQQHIAFAVVGNPPTLRIFPHAGALARAVTHAGYAITVCETEPSLMQAVGANPTAAHLMDSLQVARSALADGDPHVYLVAHEDPSLCRWMRLRDCTGTGLRPSQEAIADPRLVLNILLVAERYNWPPSRYQIFLNAADEVAALEDGRWGAAGPLHPVARLRRDRGAGGVWIQRRIARQGEKINLDREWQVALRADDLPPAEPHVREAPTFLALGLTEDEWPEIEGILSPYDRFAAALRRDLGVAPCFGPSSSQGPDFRPKLGDLETIVRQYITLLTFFGINGVCEGWNSVPMSEVIFPKMADLVRQQRRGFLGAVSHYLGTRAGINQKRAWGTTLTAIERFQEFVYAESDANDDGKGLRERVTTMATRAGVPPSTARHMMLKKAPESFERLEFLMNAYGLTFDVRKIDIEEEPL